MQSICMHAHGHGHIWACNMYRAEIRVFFFLGGKRHVAETQTMQRSRHSYVPGKILMHAFLTPLSMVSYSIPGNWSLTGKLRKEKSSFPCCLYPSLKLQWIFSCSYPYLTQLCLAVCIYGLPEGQHVARVQHLFSISVLLLTRSSLIFIIFSKTGNCILLAKKKGACAYHYNPSLSSFSQRNLVNQKEGLNIYKNIFFLSNFFI